MHSIGLHVDIHVYASDGWIEQIAQAPSQPWIGSLILQIFGTNGGCPEMVGFFHGKSYSKKWMI